MGVRYGLYYIYGTLKKYVFNTILSMILIMSFIKGSVLEFQTQTNPISKMTFKILLLLVLTSYLSLESYAGVTYVRWGRGHGECPDGARELYYGRAAGTRYNAEGGTNDYLCLPENPQYLASIEMHNSDIYGVEYPSQTTVHNHNMPCVVCYVRTRSAKFVYHGRYTCPGGWRREYYGYLMSDANFSTRNGRKSTICADVHSEPISGTAADTNPALPHFMGVECTNSELPCPPYEDGRILTCAVCTRM